MSWNLLLETWQELDVPDGWRAEILDEGITLMPPPKLPHNLVADQVHKALVRGAPDNWGIFQGLGVQIVRLNKLFIPDLVVVPLDVLTSRSDLPEPVSAEHVLLAVEITSKSNANTDRKTKKWGYAHGPVPLYVLIDVFDEHEPTTTVFADPHNGEYRHTERIPFGESFTIPEPFSIEIDSARFPS